MGQPPPILQIASPTRLVVHIGQAEPISVHPIWLRERSQDPRAVDLTTGQRLHDPSDLPLDLEIEAISDLGDGQIKIRFSDAHEAVYSKQQILTEVALPLGDHDCPPVRLWTGELNDLPRAKWTHTPTVEERHEWVEAFLKYGFIVFSEVPCEEGAVLKVGEGFGHVRTTNFGALFDVRSVPDATDLAYTAIELGAHTDNPYRSPVPGVQLLHCLINETTGGLSTLVDGFAAAEALRDRAPEAFRILSETPVRFRYQDPVTELVASAPPIELDVTGAVRNIHMSPRLDFVPLLPLAELDAYYRARKTFDLMLRDKAFEIRFLLNAGELVMFDNCRLLHGRTSFDPSEGLRHLQGCYIDIDGPRSLYRVLRRSVSA